MEAINMMKLNGTNWNVWRFQIKVVLMAKGLYEIILVTEERPTEDNDKIAKWRVKDARTQESLVTRMADDVLCHVMQCETAKDMWEKLESIFERKSEVSAHLLNEQFYNAKFQNDSINGFVTKISNIRAKLIQMGEDIPEKMVMTKIIMSLPEKFHHFRSAWESVAPENQTLNNLTARFLIEEERLKKHEEESVALLSYRSVGHMSNPQRQVSNGDKIIKKCFSCGKPGRFKRECRHLGCSYCKKRGHLIKDCFAKKKKDDRDRNGSRGNGNYALITVSSMVQSQVDVEWFMDSGASQHMCKDEDLFCSYTKLETARCIKIGDGTILQSEGQALDKLGLRHLFNISAPEPVHVNVAFDVASLILYGCQAVPIRLKILLDRLFSVLQKEEVIQVLHGFGWTIDEYARGYIVQESHGSTLDRWSICNPEEEPLVLQHFFRFGETRAITQQLLLAQQALQDRTLERLERRHSPHPRAMSPSRRPSPPNVPPSVFHSQVHAMSPHQKHPLGFLKMPPVSSGPISSNTPSNTMASSPLNRLQNMTFDYRKLSSAGLPTFPNRVSPDIGRRRTADNDSVGLNLSISTSLSSCLPPHHPPTSLSHPAAAMAVSANALAAANLVASSFPGLMSTRMSSGSKSPSSAEFFCGNNNSEEDDDADENSHSALNLSRDRDALKTPKPPRMLPGRKPSTPTKRQWGSPSLPLNLGTQFINPATGKKRVQCNVCLKTFCDKGALKIHFSAVHLREMHKCTVEGCNMMFSSRRSRNRHSANPNPKLHSPHLRRKISPHDGRSSQSHPILMPPQTGLGLPAAAALNPLNPFGPFPLLTPPPDMNYHSLATMDFKQTLDLSIQRSMEENRSTVKDFSALALSSSNHHHSEEEEDDEDGIVVVGGDEDDDVTHDKLTFQEKDDISHEQKEPVQPPEHLQKPPSPEPKPFELPKENTQIFRTMSPLQPTPISDQPEDFSMPAKKQKMSISDVEEEVLSNVDSNEDSLSVVDNHSLKDESSSVQTSKRKRKSQNPTRCALPVMMDDPVSDGDSSNDVFAERLAESTRRLEMESKIEPKKEIKVEEDRCESPMEGKRSPDVNANETEKTIGSEIKTSLAPLFLIDKLKKEKLYHDSDVPEENEDRPASSVESNKSDESFDSSNALRHLESLSHGNFSDWMSKGIHLGLGAAGSQFPPLGFMMSGGPPSPARSQASSAGSSNGGESADENSQNQLFGHFDNGQFISTMDVPIDKDNPRKCTACGKIFQNHFGVKTHYQNVHLKLMHKCNVDGCNAAFPSKRSRDRHSANLNLHRKLLSTSSDKGGSGLSPFANFAANTALHNDFLARLYADEAFKSHNLPSNMLNGDRIPPPPLLLPPPLGVLPFPLANFSHFSQFNGSAVGRERSSTSSSPVSSSPPPSNLPPSPVKYIHCVEEDLPTPDKEGNLPCRFCRTSFSAQSQLKEHCEKNHISEMFKCTIIGCPKVFVSRTRRNIHSENESLHLNILKKESEVS